MEGAESPAGPGPGPVGVGTGDDDDHDQDQDQERDRERERESRQSAQLDAEAEAERPQQKLLRLPLSRIKGLIKADPEVTLASQEAVFAIGKAAELFVEVIAKDAYTFALQAKRKTIQRKDLDNAVDAADEFAFLEGTLE